MEKLKNLLKSDTPTTNEPIQGSVNTGKLAGQGSHFPSKEENEAAVGGTGSTVTGTDPQTRGAPDVSAASADSKAAATTASPEGTGSSHVGTAAVGDTSTYKTSHLSQGEPTSSIIDSKSQDPLTYKKPEAGSQSTTDTKPSNAAAAAASLAFHKGEERKKTELSGHENPYRTSHLDPRVDGLPKDSVDTSTSSHNSSARPTAATTSEVGSTGLAGAGLSSAATTEKSHGETKAPSTLTSIEDPIDKSTEYQSSTSDKGLGSSIEKSAAAPQTEHDNSEQSVVGKVLGAVGLGGVLGGFGASTAKSEDSSAIAESSEKPSYSTSTRQGAPTSHHRKESIPTTAYPSATFDSPRAINQPLGGARSAVIHGEQGKGEGSSTATKVAAGTAAVGAAAVGAHEYQKSTSLRDEAPKYSQDTAPLVAPVHHATTLGGSAQSESKAVEPSTITSYSSSKAVEPSTAHVKSETSVSEPYVSSATSGSKAVEPVAASSTSEKKLTDPTGTGATFERAEEKDHTARDTAIGAGAGAAAVGAGVYGAHEYSKREAEKAEAEAAKAQAAQEKEIAKQKAAQEKELEQQHKAEEKAAAKEEKHHQKEIEKEEKKHQKELEKEEKKEHKAAEKEEKKHQKELEKEEKKEQKAAEKEAEKHQKLVVAEEKKQEREEAAEQKLFPVGLGKDDKIPAAGQEEDPERAAEIAALKERRQHETEQALLQKRREEEAEDRKIKEERKGIFGGAAVGGAAGGAAAVSEHEGEKEKKPSLLKRIFKRRKNKDTGEDEEYSSDDDVTPAKEPLQAYGARLGGHDDPKVDPFANTKHENIEAGRIDPEQNKEALNTYATRLAGIDDPKVDPFYNKTAPGVTERASTEASTYEQQSGGAPKPSYNPFSKDDPTTSSAKHEKAAVAAGTTAVGATAATSAHPSSKEHVTSSSTLESTGTSTAQPTGAVTGLPSTSTTGTHQKSAAPTTLDSTGTTSHQPTGAVTGLPSGTSKATEVGGTTTEAGTHHVNTDFTLGEIVEKKLEEDPDTLGQKLKDTFHMGGL